MRKIFFAVLVSLSFLTLSQSSFAGTSGEFYFASQNSKEIKYNALFPFDFYKGGVKNVLVYSNNKAEGVLLNLAFDFRSSKRLVFDYRRQTGFLSRTI